MRPVTPIDAPAGESLLALEPPPGALERGGRRLRAFAGRSLTARALEGNHRARARSLDLLGRALAPGVVGGLACSLEAGELAVDLGLGLTAAGQEVRLRSALRLPVDEIPVLAPADVVAGEGGGEDAALVAAGPLGELSDEVHGLLPPVFVVVLEPVTAESGELTGADPCGPDPERLAVADLTLIDGVRVALYAWPAERSLPAAGATWRNRLAWNVFAWEMELGRAGMLPWWHAGLPVGLLGCDRVDGRLAPRFVDRSAVVRRAGGAGRIGGLEPGEGLSAGTLDGALRTARLDQWAEDLAAWVASRGALEPAAERFRLLPPAGVLPSSVIDPEGRSRTFFPDPFRVEALPVPLSEVAAAIAESAGLAPFDLTAPELVEVLVPVPDHLYDPHLLVDETVSAELRQTVRRLETRRDAARGRRDAVDRKALALAAAIDGPPEPTLTPVKDPEAQPGETPAAFEPPEEESFGTRLEDDGTVTVLELDALAERLAANSRLAPEVAAGDEKPGEGTGRLRALGLEAFVERLEGKVNRANDRVDFGFVRVQTDIYRMRQMMLGNVDGTRLATSPTLATIARGVSATATREDLDNYLATIRKGGGAGPVTPAGDEGDEVPSRPTRPSPPRGVRPVLPIAGRPDPIFLAAERVVGDGGGGAFGGFEPRLADLDLSGFSPDGFTPPGLGLAQPKGREDSLDRFVLDAAAGATATTLAPSAFGSFFQSGVRERDVVEQTPLVGKAPALRTVSIVERIEQPPARESRDASAASKLDVVGSLFELDLNLRGLVVPQVGRRSENGEFELADRPFEEIEPDDLALDFEPPDGDEAAFFSRSVDLLDQSVVVLRRLEGVVAAYRRALTDCRKVLARLETLRSGAVGRLAEVAADLAEARHDVAVGRSLLDEESARVDDTNERRRRIFEREVEMVVFRRPRRADGRLALPHREVASVAAASPVPACLERDVEPPDEVEAMVSLLRDAPVAWLPAVAQGMKNLRRPEELAAVVEEAKGRRRGHERKRTSKKVRRDAQVLPVRGRAASRRGALGLIEAQEERLDGFLDAVLAVEPETLARLPWSTARREVERTVSVGDLLGASRGRPGIARGLTRELDRIGRVAACLWQGFAETSTVLRLAWVEILSAHDAPADLRRLSELPRWGEVDPDDRRQLQALVEHLHGRFDARLPDAVAWANDLVRVTLLVAAHAPVEEIVAARVIEPVRPRPGHRVSVRVPPSAMAMAMAMAKVKVGRGVIYYRGDRPVGRGQVEDVDGERVITRVLTHLGPATDPPQELAEGARVEILSSSALRLWGGPAARTVRQGRG